MVRESGNRIARSTTGLVAALFLAVAAIGHSQVRVELSHRSLSVGERLIYDIQIDYEEPDDVVIPEVSFQGFRLVEGPSIRPATRLSPDQRSRIVEVRLGFDAVSAGRYVLDPIAIEVAGQVFTTPPKLVEVGERGDRSKVPFLVRWVLPTDPWIAGEARAVALEIYNADEYVYPSEIVVESPPRAILEEVRGLGSIAQTTVDSVALYEIPVAVFMVTPSAAGQLEMASARVEWEGLTSTSAPARVQILDAPAAISASGAVGSFVLSASIDRSTVAATETVSLVMKLEGTGNLHFLQLPDLTLDGFLVDSETRAEHIIPGERGYDGFIEKRLVLRPTEPGTGRVTIDQFAHWDPRLRRVMRTQIPGFDIEVTPVKQLRTTEDPEYALRLLGAEEIARIEPRNWYLNPLSYGVFAPGLLVLFAIRIWRRRGAGASMVSLVIILLLGASSESLPWNEINLGIETYDSGDLVSATHAFEDASRRAPESPGIQHNLAVLYFQRGDIGRSVYAARESVRLNPSSSELRSTLLLIESAAGLERSVPAPHLIHPDLVFGLLAVSVNLLCVLLAFAGRPEGRRRAGILAIGRILLAAIAIVLVVSLALAARAKQEQVGVVLDEISLQRIPSQSAESWLDLAAGTAVEVVTRKDGFVLVRTDLGLEGWVRMDSLLWPENPALAVLRYRAFAL